MNTSLLLVCAYHLGKDNQNPPVQQKRESIPLSSIPTVPCHRDLRASKDVKAKIKRSFAKISRTNINEPQSSLGFGLECLLAHLANGNRTLRDRSPKVKQFIKSWAQPPKQTSRCVNRYFLSKNSSKYWYEVS